MSMNSKQAREFFERYGEHVVPLRFYECEGWVSVEDLYQAFARRFMDEAGERIIADAQARELGVIKNQARALGAITPGDQARKLTQAEAYCPNHGRPLYGRRGIGCDCWMADR